MPALLLLALLALVGCSSGPAPSSGPVDAGVPAPHRMGALGGGVSQGQYVASPPTLANGAISPLLVDSTGQLKTAASPSEGTTAGAASAATTLLVSTQLPAAGAYQTAPSAADAGVPIAAGSSAIPTRACVVWLQSVLGDGGTSSSQAACKFWLETPTDDGGLTWGQVASPVDQSFAGYTLQAGAGTVAVPLSLPAVASRIGISCAEVGTTSTPVVLSAWVACR